MSQNLYQKAPWLEPFFSDAQNQIAIYSSNASSDALYGLRFDTLYSLSNTLLGLCLIGMIFITISYFTSHQSTREQSYPKIRQTVRITAYGSTFLLLLVAFGVAVHTLYVMNQLRNQPCADDQACVALKAFHDRKPYNMVINRFSHRSVLSLLTGCTNIVEQADQIQCYTADQVMEMKPDAWRRISGQSKDLAAQLLNDHCWVSYTDLLTPIACEKSSVLHAKTIVQVIQDMDELQGPTDIPCFWERSRSYAKELWSIGPAGQLVKNFQYPADTCGSQTPEYWIRDSLIKSPSPTLILEFPQRLSLH